MNNPTDTNQASELFELCKEVYERTKWETSDWYDLDPDGKPEEYLCTTEDKIDENDYVPFYTSDYLLEKLPAYYEYWDGGNEAGYLRVRKWSADYEAGYWEDNATEENWQRPSRFTSGYTDTPLKALLKLTIALSGAGELK